MAAKVTWDYANRLIVPIGPPVSGSITLNVQEDIYSEGKEAWHSGSVLNGFYFPVEAIGGQVVSAGKLGTTYLLTNGWHIKPYEASHQFNIEGNIYTDDGSALVQPPSGSYTVQVNLRISTLVETVEISTGSGLSTDEHNTLYSRASQGSVDAVQADITDIDGRIPAALISGSMSSYITGWDPTLLAQIADAILARNIAGGSYGGRTVQDALRILRNHRAIIAGILRVYKEDDTTEAWNAAVTLSPRNPLQGVDPT